MKMFFCLVLVAYVPTLSGGYCMYVVLYAQGLDTLNDPSSQL